MNNLGRFGSTRSCKGISRLADTGGGGVKIPLPPLRKGDRQNITPQWHPRRSSWCLGVLVVTSPLWYWLGQLGKGGLLHRALGFVGLTSMLAGAAELDTQGWQEEHERPWYVSEAHQLARPAAYDRAFFAAALAALPQTWEYAEQDGAWLPLLDCMVKYVPQPVPVTLWTTRADATCWVGRVRIEYDGPGEAYARLYSPWSCLRVSGQWRAESFSVPPGGTNILITYLPGLRRAGSGAHGGGAWRRKANRRTG